MTERLLQYIWQFQYYNKKELQLSTGEPLQVFYPGQWNLHQGPDFLEASIRISDTKWIGNIELHVQTSDWFRHNHQNDKNYNNIILHVVWVDDTKPDVSHLPVLCLQDKVSKFLLSQYEEWMNNAFFIPCGQQIATVNELVFTSWKHRLLTERLQRKTNIIQSALEECNSHWEEVFWWLLARNFGIKVNAEAFESMAKSLPLTLLVRHKNQINQLEALLLGQAGLLDCKFDETYPMMLQKEYNYYKNKYKLYPIRQPIHFLRMRPENFPTIRLAQLAMLIHESTHLFSKVLESGSVIEIRNMLSITANDYWHYHYRFDEISSCKPKKLGDQMINNIILNTVVPMVFAFGSLHARNGYKDKAIQWLEAIQAEHNGIIQKFTNAGIVSRNAFDTQSILELKSFYCDNRRCLDCAVGNTLLKRSEG